MPALSTTSLAVAGLSKRFVSLSGAQQRDLGRHSPRWLIK
jgi:hypothetical protein